MTVGLIDVDGHNFPNLALMRISAFHKSQGDTVEWWSKERDHYDVVYKSKVFSDAYSKDVPDPENADQVIRGGSGYAIHLENGIEVFDKAAHVDLPEEMEKCFPDYSIYPQYDFAVSMTSRGCPRGCSFCHVQAKEGCRSIKVADVSDFWNGQKEIKVLDPNLTACRDKRDLFRQYRETGAKIDFTQGLDIRLLNDEDVQDLNNMKLAGLHFAWDNPEDDLAGRFAWYDQVAKKKVRSGKRAMVYVLVNYNSTIDQDLYRIYTLRDKYDPYVMVYDKPHAPKKIRQLQRWCNNKIIFKSCPNFEDYSTGKERKTTTMNSIEIYLCPEDRARIDKLIHWIDVIAGVVALPVTGEKIEGPTKGADVKVTTAPPVIPYTAPDMPMPDPNTVQPTVTAPTPVVPPVAAPTAAPAYTLAQVAKAGAELLTGKPALIPQLQELLKKYGAQTAQELPLDRLGEFAAELRAMGARI